MHHIGRVMTTKHKNGRRDSAARNITISSEEIRAFRRGWPCSGLPVDDGLSVTFDANGDLAGVDWQSGCDHWEAETSGALVVLIDDAKAGKVGKAA